MRTRTFADRLWPAYKILLVVVGIVAACGVVCLTWYGTYKQSITAYAPENADGFRIAYRPAGTESYTLFHFHASFGTWINSLGASLPVVFILLCLAGFPLIAMAIGIYTYLNPETPSDESSSPNATTSDAGMDYGGPMHASSAHFSMPVTF